jgi:type IV pilus assembly protein PilN
MIRINLLPVREARRQAGVRQQGTLLAITVACAVALSGVIHLAKHSQIVMTRKHITAAQAELRSLDEVRREVERFMKEQEEIEKKLAVIANLERSRSGPVRIMDEIATRIPKRLWLTSLSMKEGVLQLAGVSLDAEIVAAFMTSLSESPIISNVELEETKLEETEGLKLNSFKVRSSYLYSVLAASGAEQATGG